MNGFLRLSDVQKYYPYLTHLRNNIVYVLQQTICNIQLFLINKIINVLMKFISKDIFSNFSYNKNIVFYRATR